MPPFTRTVRFKLTIWYSSLLLVFGLAFIVSLNLAARLNRPDPVIEGYDNDALAWQLVLVVPGRAVTPLPGTITYADTQDDIYNQNIANLRNWSFIAVVGLAICSGIGGYALSGMLLRPVRDITEVASQISATNLSRRIDHEGPDDELKQLADTFDSMIDRLERSFEQQREFVQNASHELRTPLAAIRTNIEVTELDPEISGEEYRLLLETVKIQTERLTRLTEDLLILSTAERERPESEPISLAAVAREVAEQLGPLATHRRVSLQVDARRDVEALANGDGLYRSVFNLVDNAIKYSGDGSTVTMTVDERGAMAEIAVSDNGPGIPADKLPHIFERFYRVDKGRSRREGGTGLGLSIVKELVQAMRGTVTVDSQPGLGTRFCIRLELAEDDLEASGEAAPPRLAYTS